jgi:hypothetical protein
MCTFRLAAASSLDSGARRSLNKFVKLLIRILKTIPIKLVHIILRDGASEPISRHRLISPMTPTMTIPKKTMELSCGPWSPNVLSMGLGQINIYALQMISTIINI